MRITEIFHSVSGRNPTALEYDKISAICSALDLKDDDKFAQLITLLVGFQAKNIEDEYDVEKQVKKVMLGIQIKQYVMPLALTLSITLGIMAIFLIGGAWWVSSSHSTWYESGYTKGVQNTVDKNFLLESQKNYWGTDEFKAYYQFLKSNQGQKMIGLWNDNFFEKFVLCKGGKDWKIVEQENGKKACFTGGGGWFLP